MLALAEYRNLLCPCGCGHLAEVSQSEDNEGKFKVETPRCHARTAITMAQNRKNEPGATHIPEGVLFYAYLPDD